MLLTSGGALVSSAPTEQYRYTSCYVGALETSAPPGDSLTSVNSVKSVGEYTQQEVLCKSVKSVGEQSQQEVL